MTQQQNVGAEPIAAESWLDAVAWDARGLAPVIAQAADNGRVLTLAWVNRQALAATRESGYATYWSRSREKLWRKGERSGQAQRLVEIRLDCDGDALLFVVEQIGAAACHTGRESCFYQTLASGRWITRDPVLIEPQRLYGTNDC